MLQVPQIIDSTACQEELLSRPYSTIKAVSEFKSDIMVLGSGGKIGPSLALMANPHFSPRLKYP